jgi:hypothetical protein
MDIDKKMRELLIECAEKEEEQLNMSQELKKITTTIEQDRKLFAAIEKLKKDTKKS